MPFYYDWSFPATTHATPPTLTTHIAHRIAANGKVARIVGLYAAALNASAGGGAILGQRYATAGTAGTAIAAPNGINKVNPEFPTPLLTMFTGPTAGTTPSLQITVGFAQTGGQGGWVPLEQDDAPALNPSASPPGANGNFEIGSVAVGVSQSVRISGRFTE